MPVTDLRREDFELLEDRAPQTIDQFSPIEIRTGNLLQTRSDPRTPEDSRQAATEPRARVFVLFLDTLHVDRVASQRIAAPLTNAIRRLIGPDDLIAIMHPSANEETRGPVEPSRRGCSDVVDVIPRR